MYIDPNTGGMLFQIFAVLFGVISAAVLLFSSKVRMSIGMLRRFLYSMKTKNKKKEEPGS